MLLRKCKVFVLLVCISAVYLFLYRETYSRFSKTFFEYTSPLLDSSPCACQKCLSEGDPWFIGHFNKSVQPFLTSEYNIPEDAFNWWKHLQNDRSSLTDYREVVDKLFQIFPNRQYNTEPSPDKCRTCAVVGNSMNLKGSHYGALIDSHDIIIRMNGGHTQGYEADVGTRTTHHVMYPESAMDLGNTTHLVLFPFKTMDLRWLVSAFTTGSITVTYTTVKAKIKANKDLVMVLSPAFIKYVHEVWLDNPAHTYPSTGFMTVVLSLHMCDEVSVFGFGADSDGNWSHYWEKLKDKQFRTGLHKGPYEFKVIQQLSERQKLEMFKGL
ncbi:CMP-N-acetylneuraminate-beta-galactosamide-alpha-2,3-sialyltransferase 1-like [Myripristis murdjan]|uniref:CMP-N-acetylneuraminate-beta-galactosamide- alpha-2,3-sialyltransferase 1-like n=1 Tax=Myripristis murdjan TaxID=586833 RepID=UPI0011763110|nr:CMP-N-acetylneuraminate-beta-galactosamide-alpha-2,3-sialyltransferase 1-like [Myripristis murdjan]